MAAACTSCAGRSARFGEARWTTTAPCPIASKIASHAAIYAGGSTAGKPPNLKEIVPLVKAELRTTQRTATWKVIEECAKDPRHAGKRRPRGRTLKSEQIPRIGRSRLISGQISELFCGRKSRKSGKVRTELPSFDLVQANGIRDKMANQSSEHIQGSRFLWPMDASRHHGCEA